jgi:hypothetical protein
MDGITADVTGGEPAGALAAGAPDPLPQPPVAVAPTRTTPSVETSLPAVVPIPTEADTRRHTERRARGQSCGAWRVRFGAPSAAEPSTARAPPAAPSAAQALQLVAAMARGRHSGPVGEPHAPARPPTWLTAAPVTARAANAPGIPPPPPLAPVGSVTAPPAANLSADEQLRSNGLEPVECGGQGDCLFRSLAHHIYGDAERHARVRAEVCQQLAAGPRPAYARVLDMPAADFRRHCTEMRRQGTYGSVAEVAAAAVLYKKVFHIFTSGPRGGRPAGPSADMVGTLSFRPPSVDHGEPPLLLHHQGAHWRAVMYANPSSRAHFHGELGSISESALCIIEAAESEAAVVSSDSSGTGTVGERGGRAVPSSSPPARSEPLQADILEAEVIDLGEATNAAGPPATGAKDAQMERDGSAMPACPATITNEAGRGTHDDSPMTQCQRTTPTRAGRGDAQEADAKMPAAEPFMRMISGGRGRGRCQRPVFAREGLCVASVISLALSGRSGAVAGGAQNAEEIQAIVKGSQKPALGRRWTSAWRRRNWM